ncbi:hypothetical protein XBP1_1250004 [Xenorhabdus bovienii str. puntauvense]|uniref:Uncharacterized protein n=2 Tax=Xenorhabdus bovienii TaxID=40576 RepID=A0A077N8I6_XENBV|nr:hypothetical protein XBFFR1_2190007 [Xenorhabdus bovienii str. feltiae France]CDG92816.1 hypothetical protein XBFFL1_2320023 [Xenorhabdus bovienii str. feltiae Florida]CDG95374.1 hypothetical protein XBP1_1250004 [Xenorhabdus bovienii str. puntauvense]CDH01020.1 hypothetical protein XBFM1_1940030 [Xenorhabdus bovienii str. feltiae Moldova]
MLRQRRIDHVIDGCLKGDGLAVYSLKNDFLKGKYFKIAYHINNAGSYRRCCTSLMNG